MDIEKFGGFTPPVSNYFRMPNEWINICSEINSLAELKVVQYVLRHTWGFREYDGKPKPITIDEFMHGRISKGERMDKGTGLSKQSVIDGVKNAIKHSYLICETDDTDKGRVSKSYALNMIPSDTDVKNLDSKNRGQESRQQRSRKPTSTVKEVDSKGRESRHRSEKDTREKHFEKNTSERKNDDSQQNLNVTTQEGSFTPSSTQSSFSSLSEEVTKTYNLICQELYPNCPPNLTTKAIEHFTKLSKDIKTVEDVKSLVAYCRQEQPVLNTSKIHPGNLVRWLDGWLQSRPVAAEEVVEEPVYVVTDEELAEEVFKTARFYRDEDNFEAHLKYIKHFKKDFKLNNYDVCDKIALACRNASRDESDMQDFLYQLRCTVM